MEALQVLLDPMENPKLCGLEMDPSASAVHFELAEHFAQFQGPIRVFQGLGSGCNPPKPEL